MIYTCAYLLVDADTAYQRNEAFYIYRMFQWKFVLVLFLLLAYVYKMHNPIINQSFLPLHSFIVPCGFPSPADDHLEDNIDLVAYLVSRPSATFVMRVSGDSMEGAGILTGDYVVIDKSVETKSGHIVVAVLNGEMTLKRFVKNNDQYYLVSSNPQKYKPIKLSEDNPPEIWGVVVGVVRKCV